jgi:quercetin dioxygenase-like cupin family protein
VTVRRWIAAVAGAAAVAIAGAAVGIAGVALEGTGCARPREPAAPSGGDRVSAMTRDAAAADAAEASQEERLAAIQKAMNELDEAAQQCWAAAATERFDIEGEVTLLVDIAAGGATASVVHDTAHNAKLSACLVQILSAYRWAPPLRGQAIQLPFKFRAPDGQNTIDRTLVAWNGQGKVSVAVLLDENNTGSDAASLFEIAIAAGGATGVRRADRAELWYFLGAGRVASPSGGSHAVAAGDMMYVPRGAVRDVSATAADLHAMIAMVPGGREGAARGGALPTPESTGAPGGAAGGARSPVMLPASGARTGGAATIYSDATAIPDRTFAASILALPAGTRIPEHVHPAEAALLYVLAGSGTLTVDRVELPVTPTSVVQIPRKTRHAFMATTDVRAVLLYTPAGSEQDLKAQP